MATKTTKRSADYDPVEEALDIGFGLGREQERKRQQPKIEAARRGGRRHGRAEGTKVIERERHERAAKESAQREARRRRREEELASARRGAFASGAAKAKRDAATEAQRATSAPRPARRSSGGRASAPITAPTFSVVGGGGSSGLSRETSARLIILTIGISTVVVIAQNARRTKPGKSYTKVGNEIVAVPTNLRAIGGVFVAGTVALIVNEASPPLGLALALILGIDIVGSAFAGKTPLSHAVGANLFGKTTGASDATGAPVGNIPHQTGGPQPHPTGGRPPGAVPGTGIVRK